MASIPPPGSRDDGDDETPDSERGERTMNVIEATLWALTSVMVLATLARLALVVRPAIIDDHGAGALLQAVAYLFLLVGIRSIYFPKTRLPVMFAAGKAASWVYYPIGVLLGLALQLPTSALYDAALARWPAPSQGQEMMKGFMEGPLVQQIATVLGLVVLTPLIEETFFRGALFSGLRRRHSPLWTVIAIAALFALVHQQPQLFIPIGTIGAALAFLRHASGSIWPGFLAHAAYNGFTVFSLTIGKDVPQLQDVPRVWTLVGTGFSAGLLALVYHLDARGPRAARAEGGLS